MAPQPMVDPPAVEVDPVSARLDTLAELLGQILSKLRDVQAAVDRLEARTQPEPSEPECGKTFTTSSPTEIECYLTGPHEIHEGIFAW